MNIEIFQRGVIPSFKIKMEKLVTNFEKEFNIKLVDDFKTRYLHSYGLSVLQKKMEVQQEKWNMKNSPLELLKKQEVSYKDMIRTRLTYGYNADGEGRVIADILIAAIYKIAAREANRTRSSKIRSQIPFSNSQNVRLMYFIELAECNDTQRVVNHFSDASSSITKWYKKKVNSMFKDVAISKIYCEYFFSIKHDLRKSFYVRHI